MGRAISREAFDETDLATSARRLREDLTELARVLVAPGFGQVPPTVGAELEFFLSSRAGRPVFRADAVRTAVADRRLAPEVSQCDLELNLTPLPLTGAPFSAMGNEIDEMLERVAREPAALGARAVPIGSLPSLTPDDLGPSALTALPRFLALERSMADRRPTPFTVALPGPEGRSLRCESIAVQGAACSWQVHLTVPPDALVRTYDAAQLATGPVLSVCGNSSLVLGRRLWHEGRVPLYERGFGDRAARRPSRVAFGGVGTSGRAYDLFAEPALSHPVLLPASSPAGASRRHPHSGLPLLDELRVHLSTVWRWNRPVYDPAGHLRIEFRALPSGPTATDMAANTAFLVGLTARLAADPGVRAELSPEHAAANFYGAARSGPDARLWWPSGRGGGPDRHPARVLVPGLLPYAAEGLDLLGVDPREAGRLLDTIGRRVITGMTGAVWQQRRLSAQERHADRTTALRRVTAEYAELSAGGAPVHTWPCPERRLTLRPTGPKHDKER
nr:MULTISPECIES: glutamate--cysteine ligase [Streptomyces]